MWASVKNFFFVFKNAMRIQQTVRFIIYRNPKQAFGSLTIGER